MQTVNVTGINKGELLRLLWMRASPRNVNHSWRDVTSEIGDIEYLYGKAIKIDFSSDEINPSLYDRDHGKGAFQEVVDSIRKGQKVQLPEKNETEKMLDAFERHLSNKMQQEQERLNKERIESATKELIRKAKPVEDLPPLEFIDKTKKTPAISDYEKALSNYYSTIRSTAGCGSRVFFLIESLSLRVMAIFQLHMKKSSYVILDFLLQKGSLQNHFHAYPNAVMMELWGWPQV